MSPAQPSAADRKKAEALYQEALTAYERWDVELAIKKLESTLELNPNNPSYHMNLAQILSRAGDFDRALRALANYLRLAPDSPIASRVEQLFASGMDPYRYDRRGHSDVDGIPDCARRRADEHPQARSVGGGT
jgi:predicted Zn-dependent protease